jgi:Tfp pilus assembly protein PilE
MNNNLTPNAPENKIETTQQFSHKPKAKKVSKAVVVVALVVLLAIAGSSYGIYKWQHAKLEASAAQNIALKKQSKNLETKLATLQKGYDSVSEKLNSALKSKETDSMATTTAALETPTTSPDLTMQVNSSTRFNAQGGEDTPNIGVAVEVTLHNTSTSPIEFNIFDTSLQDSQSHVYQILYSYSGLYYPKNYVPLTNQTLQPGATVKGTLVFGVKDLNEHNFKLLYATQSYDFNTL